MRILRQKEDYKALAEDAGTLHPGCGAYPKDGSEIVNTRQLEDETADAHENTPPLVDDFRTSQEMDVDDRRFQTLPPGAVPAVAMSPAEISIAHHNTIAQRGAAAEVWKVVVAVCVGIIAVGTVIGILGGAFFVKKEDFQGEITLRSNTMRDIHYLEKTADEDAKKAADLERRINDLEKQLLLLKANKR